MKNRFAEIRKALNMSQRQFGERLGTSRDAIANIEQGRVEPTEMIIKLAAKELGVDEVWLRTGAGEMFRQRSRDEQVASFFMSTLSGDDNFKKAFITALANLDEDGWRAALNFAEDLYNGYKPGGK